MRRGSFSLGPRIGEMDLQPDRQAGRQTDRQAERHTEGQIDGRTCRIGSERRRTGEIAGREQKKPPPPFFEGGVVNASWSNASGLVGDMGGNNRCIQYEHSSTYIDTQTPTHTHARRAGMQNRT